MSSFPQCNGITGKLHAKINSTISASECLNFMVLCFCVEGPKYRDWVSNTICNKRNKTFQLNSPDGATLTVDDTKCNAADLNAWGKFFLPTTVQMQVVGYVEGSPYPCDQLVLMTCEDKKFYGYDGDELHLVAPSLEHLCRVGVDYPTSEEWDELRRGPVGQRLDKEHRQLVSKHKDSFLKNLRLGAEKRRWVFYPTIVCSSTQQT
uniref:Uncharacterized protein n=1 Tax=Oryzias sinensis TaxID=183150 RepID=A0A8C7X4R7_9TELE